MRISTTACYALHLLITLADPRHARIPVSASELSAMTGISEKFTQKILRLLNTAGIIRSVRGIAGGYVLSVSTESVTLASIIRAVEGGIAPPPPQEGGGSAGYTARTTWESAVRSMESILESFTLQEVLTSTAGASPQRINHPGVAAAEGDGINYDEGFHAKTSSLGRQRSQKCRVLAADTPTT